MERKYWNEIMQEEKSNAVDEDIFELWKFLGDKLLADIGANPEAKGWAEDTQNGKKVYVWVGEDDGTSDNNDAYDRAMGVI